ncbi:MAG TPA: glycosyltransferase family 4 protein [Thermoanaerobaculia bacterium]|nr:glycosyltransferase family 4 protein [Thermoanaerobaculia bacterium]
MQRIATTTIYAAFDRFPSRKGAAIHIDRFARTLFDAYGGGTLFVLGGADLPRHQVEGNVEIRRFDESVPNYLDRALQFGAWLHQHVQGMDIALAHFRDPWSGAPLVLRPHAYKAVYEVNALPSVELPSLFPDLAPKTLEKIRRIELDCCAAADLIVTPSHTTARLLEKLGVDGNKIEVIPNGADLDAPLPRPDDAPERHILYFGAAQSWQGVDTLLRAFARLQDFDDLRLVLCASRDSSAWRAQARLAERLGIGDRIVWRYELAEPELARWRQHALVSVAPLTDCERNVVQGCAPLKILESMASGCAVVASDVPPVRELIRDRENGWLVHPERPAELARAIRILIDDPPRARVLGENARRTIAERFTWARSTEALRRAYDRVLKGVAARECPDSVPVSLG